MIFRQLIDYETQTYTYLLADQLRRKAVLIDPVLGQVDRDIQLIEEMGLQLEYTLETGIHGDHKSGAAMLRARTGSKVLVPAHARVQGADQEISHGDAIYFGLHALEARSVPGRRASNMMYVTSDLSRAFVGSTLLIRDLSRVDHPDSDPRQLFHSLQDNILTLPSHTELYPGRDYHGHTVTSVAEERQNNPYLKDDPTEEEFLARLLARELPDRDVVDTNQNYNMQYQPQEAFELETSEAPWAPILRTVTGIPEVTAEWVKESPRNYQLIDVRGVGEFHGDLGHIEGAKLVTLNTLGAVALSWDRNEHYVTVCRSGGRSGRAAAILEQMGFTNVASMAGGMNRWSRLRYPVNHD